VVIDHVEYDDNAPWPEEADMGGASLEPIGPVISYGNDPHSWRVTDRLGGTPRQGVFGPIGDVNGDSRFSSSDLVLVFQAGEYEDATEDNSTFLEGDWNGDGEFDGADLILAFQAGHYEREAVARSADLAAAVDRLFAQNDSNNKRPAFVA
jgi:hypothetical protein